VQNGGDYVDKYILVKKGLISKIIYHIPFIKMEVTDLEAFLSM